MPARVRSHRAGRFVRTVTSSRPWRSLRSTQLVHRIRHSLSAKLALAITAGIDEHEYAASGKYRYTVEELTRPFELTFEYVKADYRPPFVFYGIELNSSEEWIEQSVPRYMKFLDEFSR